MRAEASKIKVMAVMRKRSCPSEETKLHPKEDGKEEDMDEYNQDSKESEREVKGKGTEGEMVNKRGIEILF